MNFELIILLISIVVRDFNFFSFLENLDPDQGSSFKEIGICKLVKEGYGIDLDS